ncbi:ankyrin repeat-containing domain protein, partial [Coprinopsis sp. MPI-PUGE-AT-0042]
MRAEDRPILLRLLASLGTNLFVTSRPLETLQQQFPEAEVFNITASASDIDLHIKDFLRHSPDVMALLEGTSFEERIVEAIHRKSGGMFLHAKLQLEALRQCINSLDMEETLEAFPTDIGTIYTKTWERILAQGPKHSNLAKLVLLWITHSHSEMTINTLRRAVATSPETHVFDPKRMVPEALLLSVCCGLVSVDEKTKLVRLIHYTTRDAILPRILELYPTPHAILAYVCIAHLTTCGLQNYCETAMTCDNEDYKFRSTVHDFNRLLRDDSLLAYAHRSWTHHTRQCHRTAHVMLAVAEFVLNCTTYPFQDREAHDFGGSLHIAAFYDLEELIPEAARLQSPTVRTTFLKSSPLIIAVKHGHLACARAILSVSGIDVNLGDRYGQNALMHAVIRDETKCAQVLLEAPGIQIDAADKHGCTALHHSAIEDRAEMAKLLLELPGIDVNAASTKGYLALMYAAKYSEVEVVHLFLGLPSI